MTISTDLRFMRRWQRIAAVALPVALLGACTTPPPDAQHSVMPSDSREAPTIFKRLMESPEQTALRTLTTQQDQLYRVAAPLLTHNTPLCQGNARNLLGFTAKNKYAYPPEYFEAAQALGLGDRLQITGVLPESGAAKSGLQRHDTLVSAGNKAIPKGPDAERQTAILLGPMVSSKAPVKLTIERDGVQKSTVVPLTLACAFNIELGNSDNVNSYADGRRVLVTRGMLNFTQNDEELAYVIAKEIAHNALGHGMQQRMVATVGGVIDNLLRLKPDVTTLAGTAGIRPYPQNLDTAADTLGLYMLARAGYNIDNALPFWKRLAAQYPANVPNSYTAIHPATEARYIAIAQAVQTIKAKQDANEDLVP